MNIDWSKAPKGATHHLLDTDGIVPQSFAIEKADRYQDIDSTEYLLKSDIGKGWKVTRRPSSEWNGQGLPPVGMVCEVEYDTGKVLWHEAEIIHHKSDDPRFAAAILRINHPDKLVWFSQFRPIRTPEQIAADEREKAIDEMVGLMCQDGAFDPEDPESTAAMGKLYDAGYRKQEQPK